MKQCFILERGENDTKKALRKYVEDQNRFCKKYGSWNDNSKNVTYMSCYERKEHCISTKSKILLKEEKKREKYIYKINFFL